MIPEDEETESLVLWFEVVSGVHALLLSSLPWLSFSSLRPYLMIPSSLFLFFSLLFLSLLPVPCSGYVKMSIIVLGPGDEQKIHTAEEEQVREAGSDISAAESGEEL